MALKEYMERNHVAGTLRYYGTPAEEGGDGKVYMIRAGLFRDVDVVLQWHPGSENDVINGGMLAINSARFLFHGVAAHAAMAPDRGRSALDAVMLMGNGIEFLREHIPSNSRIHYIITNGGAAPNVVPDTAELYLYARNPSSPVLGGIWDRILKIGQGAALMTETTLDVKEVGGDANVLPNDALAKVAQRNLEEVGGFRYTAEEKHFARGTAKELACRRSRRFGFDGVRFSPFGGRIPTRPPPRRMSGTSVGTSRPSVLSRRHLCPEWSPHTWQAAASAGMSIGQKGMIVAAKALAATGADLFSDRQLVLDAKADFRRQMKGKTYQSVIPAGQKPPLNYRNK